MKHKFLSLLGIFCLLCTSQVWGWSFTEGKYLYLDNTVSDIPTPHLRVGRSGNDKYVSAYGMTQISHTNLWYYQIPKWDDYGAFTISNDCGWTGSNTIYQPFKDGDEIKPNGDRAITSQLVYQNYNLSSHLLLRASSKGDKTDNCQYWNVDNVDLPEHSAYAGMNFTQTVTKSYSDDGGENYLTASRTMAKIEISSYQLSNYTTTEVTSSTIDSSATTSSTSVTAAQTATVRLKVSKIDKEYTFVGWFNSSNEPLSYALEYSYKATAETTIYARFAKDSELPQVYFDNTLGWEKVYVYFNAYWDTYEDKGAGANGKPYGLMKRIGNTNRYYYAYDIASPSVNIAFANEDMHNYNNFYGNKAIYRSDFDATKSNFVPCNCNNVTKNETKYYSKGFWKTLADPYQYYLKNTWGGTTDKDWSWKLMSTEDGTTYTLSNVGYSYGFGYNYNFIDDECGKSDYITDYTKVGVLETGDKVNIEFTPANGKIKVTLIPTNLNVTIGSTGYATYYYSKPYIVPADVQVQYITGVDDRALTNAFLKEGDIIPANEGVILHGEQGDYIFGGTTEVPEKLADNMLTGTLTATEINNGLVHYIMTLNDQSKVGLFWPYGTTEGVGGFTNGAHKAYLEIPAGSSAPRRIGYAFDEVQTPTGVVDVNENVNANRKVMINNQLIIIRNGVRYNANGQMIKINGTW